MLASFVAVEPPAAGANEETRQADEQAIRAAAQQYIEALEKGDAETLRAMWVADGDIVDAQGQSAPASEVIQRELEGRAANEDPAAPRRRVEIKETKIRFLTDDVAIEDGRVDVATGVEGLPPAEGRFSAVWVKGDGKWRLATLREARLPQTPVADLAALEWMVGDWTGELGKATFHVSTHWNEKHTYLVRDLQVSQDGKVVFNGGQRIGIDPLDGKIKSWMHDADGGHGEGTWTRHGNTWTVLATGVTPDGRRTSATNIYAPEGTDGMLWKSTAGFSEGQPVPGFEIMLKRVAESAKQES
jgi:uncharacterized protein (TIGR02246 family)